MQFDHQLKKAIMANLTKNLNLLSFKDGIQNAELDGVYFEFNFTESELADSIEAHNNDLSYRSGLHRDDYTAKEMAIEIASNWEDEDVLKMILDLPQDELEDYRKEADHAA